MKKVLVVLVGLLTAASAVAADLSVSITVEEPSGIARTAEPVSGGIPLPWGQYKKGQEFWLFEGNVGVPLQALPLVVDENGYLRWILLDFQTDLGAKEKKVFTLKAVKPPPGRPWAMVSTDDAAQVAVDTGKVKFAIAKDKPFTLFTTVSADGKELLSGGEVSYTENTNAETKANRYVADKPSSVVVEYAGPRRVTVCIKGGFVGDEQTGMTYVARITAWAGRSDVHVKYSLANSNEKHYTWRRIQDSSIEMKLAANADGAILGTSKPADADAPCWMQQTMRVVTAAVHGEDELGNAGWLHKTPGAAGPGGCKAVANDKDLWTSAGKGDVSEGWAAAKVGGRALLVTDLYFVEDPPRRLAVNKGSILLAGVVEPLAGTTSPFCDKNRWMIDSSHLSSQYVLDFGAAADAGALSQKAKAARARLIAVAPPAWYFETEGLPVGKFGTQQDELTCYDTWGWKYDAKQVPTDGGIAGRMPRWSGGDDNHYTSEQDTLDALMLMFFRTGKRVYFNAAESWGNYFMDLESWRTDGWRYKDGGVWWPKGGPLGNSPQRPKDPMTGVRNGVPGAPWGKAFKAPFTREAILDLWFLAIAKQCHCHNWGEGLAEWFLLTGDRDGYEAAMDCVEQNFDTQKRAFGKTPGKASGYSRDFTRSCYLTNAARLIAPADPFVIEASDYLANCYLQRPNKEPRGLCNTGGPHAMALRGKGGSVEDLVGAQGIAEMEKLGVTYDEKTSQLTDPKTGAKWYPLSGPHTWMYPPLSRAMETYYRITGNEDAMDWLVAFGQGAAYVLFQPKHGNLSYGGFLADFPVKGVSKDWASWVLPEDSKNGEGVTINGYLAQFYPDVPARGYELTGDPFLKQRAYDFWYWGSHRGYNSNKMHNIGGVGWWINCYTTHSESVCFTGKTIYEWSHPRKDDKAPKPVTDLKVTVDGDKATVSFTAPPDEGGGKVARYQVKCSDKRIVSYEDFLKLWAGNEDSGACNWWMAANLKDEPTPKAAGAAESFTVTGVPATAKFFSVCSFDDSSNRSAMSPVVEVK